MKRSVNLNRARKSAGLNAKNVADLLDAYGVTAEDLKAYYRKRDGTHRQRFTCPRCQTWVETEVNNFDQSAVCPSCENDVIIGDAHD